MLKDRKYFVTFSFLMSQNFSQFFESPEEKFGDIMTREDQTHVLFVFHTDQRLYLFRSSNGLLAVKFSTQDIF